MIEDWVQVLNRIDILRQNGELAKVCWQYYSREYIEARETDLKGNITGYSYIKPANTYKPVWNMENIRVAMGSHAIDFFIEMDGKWYRDYSIDSGRMFKVIVYKLDGYSEIY